MNYGGGGEDGGEDGGGGGWRSSGDGHWKSKRCVLGDDRASATPCHE